MAVDDDQLIRDAECIIACMTAGMIQAAILAAMVPATIVIESSFGFSANGVKLLSANPKRRYAVIQNLGGATPLFIGPSTVTTSGSTQGLQVSPSGAGVSNALGRVTVYTTGELYGASAGTNVRVLEFLVP